MIVIRIYAFSEGKDRLLDELRKSLREEVENAKGMDSKGGVWVFFPSESSLKELDQGIAVYVDGLYYFRGSRDTLATAVSSVVQKFFPKSIIQTSVRKLRSEEVSHVYDPRKIYGGNL